MRLLLDTSVFIALASESNAIPNRVRKWIDAADVCALSVASVWEIAIKCSVRKLTLPISSEEWIRTRASRMMVDIEAVRFEHATQVEGLPLHHRDPFDRLLIAQALVDDYTLVTHDRKLKKYAVRLLPAWS